MSSLADEGILNITNALKKKGMWDNTLILFSSDNGGPSGGFSSATANNYPLRGGKHSDLEGGVRVTGFLSGPVIPKELRNTSLDGYIHISDWYSTFATIAGLDPFDEEASYMGLPAIDSID